MDLFTWYTLCKQTKGKKTPCAPRKRPRRPCPPPPPPSSPRIDYNSLVNKPTLNTQVIEGNLDYETMTMEEIDKLFAEGEDDNG